MTIKVTIIATLKKFLSSFISLDDKVFFLGDALTLYFDIFYWFNGH